MLLAQRTGWLRLPITTPTTWCTWSATVMWVTTTITSTTFGVRPVVSLQSGVRVEWKSESDANNDGGYYEIVGK